MMIAFGRFLEISIPTRDILQSLAFYRALGFTECVTGDIRAWHYAVVTDGEIVIGLHQGGIEEPALTFVRPQLAQQVAALAEAGYEFEWQRLGSDEFNEAALRTPDGQLLHLLEGRTYSPGEPPEPTLLGRCSELRQRCTNTDATRRWFEAAGFMCTGVSGEADSLRLQAPGLTIGLHDTGLPNAATLHFAVKEPRELVRALEDQQFNVRRSTVGYFMQAPEGTQLIIGS